MNTSTSTKPIKATKIWFKKNKLTVLLEDAREISIPLDWYPKLRDATIDQLENYRFIGGGIGIHWEDLDEDLSVQGFLT